MRPFWHVIVVLCRLNGNCKACPNTAWLLFLGFFLALGVAVSVAIYLSRKRVNLAGLSIGVVRVSSCPLNPLRVSFRSAAPHAVVIVTLLSSCLYIVHVPSSHAWCLFVSPQDVLQILAMFSSFKFRWPGALTTIYDSFSFANFNIELL